MELKNINTKNFLFDPKDDNFEQKMIERSSVFDLKKDRKKWLTYITLVYDLQSEIRRNQRDYTQRKIDAAKISGFELVKDGERKNRFTVYAENTLVGENDDFNRAVIQLIYYMFNNDYKMLFILEEQYNNAMSNYSSKLVEFDEKTRKLLTTMKEQIEEIESKLFGGVEVINMRKALYAGIDGARERMPRKEVEIEEYEKNGLIDYSPYPGYTPNKIVFAGDKDLTLP
jgi:hypothetical protein